MTESDFSTPFIVRYGFLLSSATPSRQWDDTETSQVPVQCVRACMGFSTPRDSNPNRHIGGSDVVIDLDQSLAIADIHSFGAQQPRTHAPLSTLDPRPRERWPMTRGEGGGLPSPSCRTSTGYTGSSQPGARSIADSTCPTSFRGWSISHCEPRRCPSGYSGYAWLEESFAPVR